MIPSEAPTSSPMMALRANHGAFALEKGCRNETTKISKESSSKAYFFRFHVHFFQYLSSCHHSHYVHQLLLHENPVTSSGEETTHTSAPEQSVPNFKALDPSPLESKQNEGFFCCCLANLLFFLGKKLGLFLLKHQAKPFFKQTLGNHKTTLHISLGSSFFCSCSKRP